MDLTALISIACISDLDPTSPTFNCSQLQSARTDAGTGVLQAAVRLRDLNGLRQYGGEWV